MEQIALDMGRLLAWQFPALQHRADEVRNAGLVARMRAGGRILFEEVGLGAVTAVGSWQSDTLRGWAAMAVGYAPALTFDERLERLLPFADDHHFAVREWAWLSLRPHVAADVRDAIARLEPLSSHSSSRVRRFITEATRPRGVWSTHLPELKIHPALGLPLLEPLRGDESRYVQDSVANWLNDAAKTRGDWVRSLCAAWQADDSGATARICRRALRSLQKS
jgi:3-methyladenine DNA glycosylase AlkC